MGYTNALAHVYVNGEYAGLADKLPRTEPGPGEEDPGQGFTYDLPATNLGGYEVEFVIVNGDETFTALTQVSVNESPFTDHYRISQVLWEGIYDRSPESAEINAYLAALRRWLDDPRAGHCISSGENGIHQRPQCVNCQ